MAANIEGTIYLLHFDTPLAHARHYLGWTGDLDTRLSEHGSGRGARLLQVANERGITFRLARTWAGDRFRERALKKQGGKARMCPVCQTHREIERGEDEMDEPTGDWRPHIFGEAVAA